VRHFDARLAEAAETLRTNPEHVSRKIESLLEEKKQLEKKIEELLKGGGGSGAEAAETLIGEIRLIVGSSPVDDRGQIGLLMDSFRDQNSKAIKILFASGERPGIHVAVTDDLVSSGVRAGDLVQRIAQVSGGKGGGRPHFASAGAGDPAKLDQARFKTPEIVKEYLPG
jgi:alanyl-tRNA synthetase